MPPKKESHDFMISTFDKISGLKTSSILSHIVLVI